MSSTRMMTEAKKVFIVDDDTAFVESVVFTLNSIGYDVEAFSTADSFLAQWKPESAVTVLIDLLLPGMTGLGLCRELVARKFAGSFAVISGHADVASAVEAMKLGAIDLLEKPFSRQRLLEVVNKAIDIASARARISEEDAEAARQLATLTPREHEILHAISEGAVTKQIANKLGISARTVDVHRSRIMQKLGLESPNQLVQFLLKAFRNPSSNHAKQSQS